jgi:hypothetical protein
MPRRLRRERINLKACVSALQTDHLDGNKQNNDPDNLVPVCSSCNKARERAGNPRHWRLATVERERLRASEQVRAWTHGAGAGGEIEDSRQLSMADRCAALLTAWEDATLCQ